MTLTSIRRIEVQPLNTERKPVYAIRMAVVSTRHIKETDDHILRTHISSVSWLGDVVVHGELRDDVANHPRISNEAKSLVYKLFGLGFNAIRFSGECGDVLDGVPTFDW